MGDSEQSITLLFPQAEGEGGAESPSLEKHLKILNTVNLLLQPPPKCFAFTGEYLEIYFTISVSAQKMFCVDLKWFCVGQRNQKES